MYYPDGTSELYTYTLLDLTGRQDRLGHSWTAGYDEMRRLTSATDRNHNTTSFGYCLCGGLASVTDPLGNTTTYNRNLAGWVNSLVFTGTGGNSTMCMYGRDAVGRATSVADSDGLNLNYIYMFRAWPRMFIPPRSAV